jgi:aminopeptidase N
LNDQEGVYGVFNFDSGDQVLTLANWFPILAAWQDGDWQVDPVYGVGDAVVSETALYEVEVTAPKDWQIVTTGSEIGRTDLDGGVVHKFTSGPARDFAVVASPNFAGQQMETDGVLVRHWGLPDGEGRWGEAMQATLDALAVFDQRFGAYPYAELDVVAVPLELASGVEYPGLFLLEKQLYRPDEELPFLLGLVAAHEVAHQWWYGVVGNDVLAHPWQDEALATFSSLVYQEKYQPEVLAGTITHYQEDRLMAEDSTGDTGIDQPVQDFLDRIETYSPVVYSKGALFFVDLRREIGDRAFFEALRSYYAKYAGQIATPEDLLGEFENACQCELDNVYTQWGVE